MDGECCRISVTYHSCCFLSNRDDKIRGMWKNLDFLHFRLNTAFNNNAARIIKAE